MSRYKMCLQKSQGSASICCSALHLFFVADATVLLMYSPVRMTAPNQALHLIVDHC